MKILIVLLTAGVLATSGVIGGPLRTSESTIGETHAKIPGSYQELAELLGEVRRAWNPRVKQRLVADSWRPELQTSLVWLLSQRAHEWMPEAIYVAGGVVVEAAYDPLVGLSFGGPTELRADALRAASLIAAWPANELSELMTQPDPATRIAALEQVVRTPDGPWSQLFDLLEDPEEAVREAVVAVVPATLHADVRRDLLARVEFASGETQALLIRIIGKGAIDSPAEQVLLSVLIHGESGVRCLALDVLATKTEPLSQARMVWGQATEHGSDGNEKAKALRCLEQTGSYSVPQLLSESPYLNDALCKYIVARCLVRAANKHGAIMLLDLLDESQEGTLDEVDGFHETGQMIAEIEELLTVLAASDVECTTEAWREWLDGVDRLPSRYLDDSELTF